MVSTYGKKESDFIKLREVNEEDIPIPPSNKVFIIYSEGRIKVVYDDGTVEDL